MRNPVDSNSGTGREAINTQKKFIDFCVSRSIGSPTRGESMIYNYCQNIFLQIRQICRQEKKINKLLPTLLEGLPRTTSLEMPQEVAARISAFREDLLPFISPETKIDDLLDQLEERMIEILQKMIQGGRIRHLRFVIVKYANMLYDLNHVAKKFMIIPSKLFAQSVGLDESELANLEEGNFSEKDLQKIIKIWDLNPRRILEMSPGEEERLFRTTEEDFLRGLAEKLNLPDLKLVEENYGEDSDNDWDKAEEGSGAEEGEKVNGQQNSREDCIECYWDKSPKKRQKNNPKKSKESPRSLGNIPPQLWNIAGSNFEQFLKEEDDHSVFGKNLVFEILMRTPDGQLATATREIGKVAEIKLPTNCLSELARGKRRLTYDFLCIFLQVFPDISPRRIFGEKWESLLALLEIDSAKESYPEEKVTRSPLPESWEALCWLEVKEYVESNQEMMPVAFALLLLTKLEQRFGNLTNAGKQIGFRKETFYAIRIGYTKLSFNLFVEIVRQCELGPAIVFGENWKKLFSRKNDYKGTVDDKEAQWEKKKKKKTAEGENGQKPDQEPRPTSSSSLR